MSLTLYDILEVPRYASADQVKTSFRKLAVKYHPDKNPGNREFEERFKQISSAYTILSDPDLKQEYDTRLAGVMKAWKEKQQKENNLAERRRRVMEILKKRKEDEDQKIINDWNRLHQGISLNARRMFYYALMATGSLILFKNWFYTIESFSPISFLLAFGLIITGNILQLNLGYTILLYKNVIQKLNFNLYKRVLRNLAFRMVICIGVAILLSHLMVLYHFSRFSTYTQADVYVTSDPASLRKIAVFYRFHVNGKAYSRYIPEEQWDQVTPNGKIKVRYSRVNPVFSKPAD